MSPGLHIVRAGVAVCAIACWAAPIVPTPAANLLTDGASFEAGLDGCALAVAAGQFDREAARVVLECDATAAVDGARSLRFQLPARCLNRYGLFYKPVALRPGRPYVLSAFVKCSDDGGQAGLMLGAFPEKEQKAGVFTGRPAAETFRLSREWKRYELRIPQLSPSATADGKPGFGLYYAAITPLARGESAATFWIDAVQLEEGAATGPFSTGKRLEVALASNRPGSLFHPGETIVPTARIHAPGAVQPLQIECRVTDLLDGEVAASRRTATVPADGYATVELEGYRAAARAWLMFEVTVSTSGSEEKEYLSAAVVDGSIAPPLPDQPCQVGFDFNMLLSADVFGAGETWSESNVHLDIDRVFRLAPLAGAQWLRMAGPFFWEGRRSCETAPGKFEFYDDAVKAARGYGLRLMGTLGNANARADFCPEWAIERMNSRGSAIPKLDCWRRYVRTMVEHYKAEIRAWEIINEPNTGFLSSDYLPLLKAAYEEAKAADPGCTVVGICATSEFEDPFGYIRAMSEAGGLAFVDAVSAHTLCKGRPWQSRSEAMTWDYIAAFREILARGAAGRPPLPIWNTEGVKYGAFPDRPNIPRATIEYASQRLNRNMALPQRWAAAYVVRDCLIEYSSGLGVLYLWEFRNALVNANIAHAGALGLMDWFGFDGVPHAKFVAMNALAARLRGARPVEQFGLSPQVRCAVFDSPAGPWGAIWRENEDESDVRSYVLPLTGDVAARLEAQDLFGRPAKVERTAGALRVTISEIPVYLAPPAGVSAAALAAAIKSAGRQVDFQFDKPMQNPLIRRAAGKKQL